MSITGHPDAPPVKIGVPITDLNAGMYAALGVLSAYINRLNTGQGQHVDTSLLEAGLAYTIWESAIYFATGESPGPPGSGHPLSAPYQAFATKDGHINLGGANQANWERLCPAIGLPDLVRDPRFATNADRNANLAALVEILDEAFAARSTSEWTEVLNAAGVPAGPIHDMSEVYSDPQVLARDMVAEMDHPTAGKVRNIGIPLKLSETPGTIRRPAPTLGQHTDEVLAEFGYSEEDIASLRDRSVVG